MFKTADGLVARLDTLNRGTAAQPSRPFDIREYTEAVKQLAVAAERMNDLLKSSDKLLGSSDWDRRLAQVNQAADDRMRLAAAQSQLVVNNFFWRVYVAMGVLLVMVIICLAAVILLLRRRRVVAAGAAEPAQANRFDAGKESRPPARDGGEDKKGMAA